MSDAEIALIPGELRAVLDVAAIRLIDRAYTPFRPQTILVRGHDIYWPDCPSDFTSVPQGLQGTLIHELTHVWQYRTGRLSAAGYLLAPENWVYRYLVEQDAAMEDYPIEKQADLVEDWFRVRVGLPPARYDPGGPVPSREWLERVVSFSPPQYPLG